MDRLFEATAIDGAVAEAGHSVEAAAPAHTHAACLNCDAGLHGRYCHVCGQSADDHHRSILHLLWEAVEGFTHLDGRLAKTLPALLFAPGRLARDHIEGRRVRHVPPFRLFLITLLIFMFAAETVVHRVKATSETVASTTAPHGASGGRQVTEHKVVVEHTLDARDLQEIKAAGHGELRGPLGRWLEAHIGRAVSNREYYLMLVFEWAHRLAILMLPILAGLLTLLYVYKRQFYIYDHLVVSMQYLSFCFLLWAIVWVAPSPLRGVLILPAIAWTPFNLYLILRTAYGSHRLGAAVKALFVWTATVMVFGALTAGLLLVALNQV